MLLRISTTDSMDSLPSQSGKLSRQSSSTTDKLKKMEREGSFRPRSPTDEIGQAVSPRKLLMKRRYYKEMNRSSDSIGQSAGLNTSSFDE